MVENENTGAEGADKYLAPKTGEAELEEDSAEAAENRSELAKKIVTCCAEVKSYQQEYEKNGWEEGAAVCQEYLGKFERYLHLVTAIDSYSSPDELADHIVRDAHFLTLQAVDTASPTDSIYLRLTYGKEIPEHFLDWQEQQEDLYKELWDTLKTKAGIEPIVPIPGFTKFNPTDFEDNPVFRAVTHDEEKDGTIYDTVSLGIKREGKTVVKSWVKKMVYGIASTQNKPEPNSVTAMLDTLRSGAGSTPTGQSSAETRPAPEEPAITEHPIATEIPAAAEPEPPRQSDSAGDIEETLKKLRGQ